MIIFAHVPIYLAPQSTKPSAALVMRLAISERQRQSVLIRCELRGTSKNVVLLDGAIEPRIWFRIYSKNGKDVTPPIASRGLPPVFEGDAARLTDTKFIGCLVSVPIGKNSGAARVRVFYTYRLTSKWNGQALWKGEVFKDLMLPR